MTTMMNMAERLAVLQVAAAHASQMLKHISQFTHCYGSPEVVYRPSVDHGMSGKFLYLCKNSRDHAPFRLHSDQQLRAQLNRQVGPLPAVLQVG
jgi:hypothetical protein